jgi:hypothetical protein
LKKLFSSVFIVLILLNVVGYYGILIGLKYNNAREMMKQFDAGNYNIDETSVIKIPFKTSQLLNSELFERVDGDFERDGETYRLIKQRLYRDTFHIVYIKDKTGTIINKVMADYARTFSDAPSEDGKQSLVLPVFIKDYFVRSFSIQQVAFGWEQILPVRNREEIFIDDFTSSIVHPPERG